MNDIFSKKRVNLKIIVGHCERGNYLIVPKLLFGTDTIFLNKDEFCFELTKVLENNINDRNIDGDLIETFKSNPTEHIINHTANGWHVVRYHHIILPIICSYMNDDFKFQYDIVKRYIKLKQIWYDCKKEVRKDSKSLENNVEDETTLILRISTYTEIRDRFIEIRKNAKDACVTKERFDMLVRYYWQQQSIKK